MILEELISCELGVILFIVGIITVSDLLLIYMGVTIYRFREKITKQQLNVLLVLLGINLIVFTSYGISTLFVLPESRCL